jgi:hypothetical protein
MTATVNIHAAAEQIADEVFGEKARPTPEEIGELAREYEAAKLHVADERENLARVEERAVILVQTWGVVPAHAEKSRRLVGKLSELLVTRADTLTVVDDRVETLKGALEANGYGEYFKKLFTLRSKYEVVEGAETALKSESLPKRLSEKVLNLWGRCITVKPKKPSLKVTIADPAKPAKKAKKAGK